MKNFAYLLLGASLMFTGVVSAEDSIQLEEAYDLYQLGETAYERDVPILVMFSQKGCTYCIILEEDYLGPMLKSGDYKNKVIIRKIRIDSYETVRHFNGREIDAADFAGDYRAYVTPTMVFLDHNGKELAGRLMGIGTEGFFAHEIDQAIDKSLIRLRSVAMNK